MVIVVHRPSPVVVHWSELETGDVVRTADTVWTRVDRVDHHIYGLITVSGEDATGSKRDQAVTRWLRKSRLCLVRRPTPDPPGEAREGRIPWTRIDPLSWSAPGYAIRRSSPQAMWEVLRAGEPWDRIESLRLAKDLCEVDLAISRRAGCRCAGCR